MVNIVLISPYDNVFAIGLRVLSSCLKKEGHSVKLLFLTGDHAELYKDSVLNEIVNLSKDADVIGVSLMTNFFARAVQLTQGIKKRIDVPVIWGGIHPTVRPIEALNYADMVCLGEGEESLVELVAKIKSREEYLKVRGIWFKHQKEIIKNEIRPLIKDLSSIPFQDFDYETHYILVNDHLLKVDESLLRKNMTGHYTTVASRGCFFECSYCANSALNKLNPNERGIRKRDVESIMAELTMVKKRLPFIKFIQLDDDAFLAYTKEEITDFAKQYKRDIGLPLGVTGISPININVEKIALLVDSGLKYVRMGIQTASERTKKLYKRYHSNEQVEKAAKLMNQFKNNLDLIVFDIILDNPWETDDDLIATLMFLTRLPTPYFISIYSLTFYPGTELYDKAIKEGVIKDGENDVYNKFYGICKKTYLNRLFFLLRDYAAFGFSISPMVMSMLTNKKNRYLRINWLFYYILRAFTIPFSTIKFIRKGYMEIRKGNFSKIIAYLRGKLKI